MDPEKREALSSLFHFILGQSSDWDNMCWHAVAWSLQSTRFPTSTQYHNTWCTSA